MHWWIIGTNISKYLNFFCDIKDFFETDKITFKKNEQKNVYIETETKTIIDPLNYKQKNSVSTFRQIISTWMGLGLIEFDGYKDENFCLQSEEYFNKPFKILFPIKNKLEKIDSFILDYFSKNKNFLNKLNNLLTFEEENDLNLEELTEKDISNIFDYKNEINFLFSFFISNLDIKFNFNEDIIKNIFLINEKKTFKNIVNYFKIFSEDILKNNKWKEFEKNAINFCFKPSQKALFVKNHEKLSEKRKIEEFENFKLKKSKYIVEKINDNDINCSNFSFGNLIIKNIKNNYKFKIPVYQRNYRWNKSIIKKLINDILLINNNEQKKYHYMGSLIIKKAKINENGYDESYNILKIVDGQQRLTSLLIILKALYDTLINENIELNNFLIDLFKVEENENEITNIFSHLENSKDFNLFKDLMIKKSEKVSNSSLFKKNYNFACDELSTLNFYQLNNFAKNLINNVIFTYIEDNVSDEFKLFENMNTQKVELENIELIKNILIMNINNEELYKNENEIYNIFDEKILSHFTIKGKINDSDINNFISVFVKYYRSLIKINSELYNEIIVANNNKDILYELFKKIILDIIKNNISVKNYGMNLQEYKNVISLISNKIILFKEITTKEKYFQTSSFLYPISDILFSFERRMIYIPTIMFIISKYLNEEGKINENFNDLREILFEFEKYEIMFQTVLFKGQSLTKVIDNNIFEKVIKLEIINKENIQNLFSNKETMKNYSIPSINEFKNYLKNGRLKDKIVTIVGFRINFYLENKKSILLINRHHRYNCPMKPTREHIMPQDIKNWINDLKEWTKLDKNKIIENHNSVLHLLGNSMTLNNWTNSSASNLEWKKKKLKYDKEPNCSVLTQYKGFIDEETNMVVLDDISTKYKWDFDDINIRNNQIIKLLIKIYE